MLANTLGRILSSTISQQQSAFVKGRHILYAALIANKVVEDLKRHNKQGVVLKLDFEKVYDRLSWSFLDSVLERKGFRWRWRGWIQRCLKSTCFAVIINGKPKSWFTASRGLKQGDPLSPFLFTLATDIMSRMLSKGVDRGFIEGLRVGRGEGLMVSHLQYADDAIMFTSANLDSLRNIPSPLVVFQETSGPESTISGIHLNDNTLQSMATLAG